MDWFGRLLHVILFFVAAFVLMASTAIVVAFSHAIVNDDLDFLRLVVTGVVIVACVRLSIALWVFMGLPTIRSRSDREI